MADYFTHFSCIFDVGSAEHAEGALIIRERLEAELDEQEGCEPGFGLERDPYHGPGALWISSDGYGEPEHVIDFVLRCAEAFDLSGQWGFVWALTCSKPRLDGFGGGAQLIDLGERRSLAWLDCEHWLASGLDTAISPEITVVNTTADGGEPVMGTSMDTVQNAPVVVDAPPIAAP